MALLTSNWISDILLLTIATLAVTVYKRATKTSNYWKTRGVPYESPAPFLGNFASIIFLQETVFQLLHRLYNKYRDVDYFGMFIFNRPYLVVRSPEIIQNILVKDFHIFSDHPSLSDQKVDPIGSKILFFSKSPEWKVLRKKMTPVFTSSKVILYTKSLFCSVLF